MRVVAVATLLALTSVPVLSSQATGREELSDLQARMDAIQAELNAAQARIEELRTRNDELHHRIEEIGYDIERLQRERASLRKQAVKRATELYIAGNTAALEVLFGADTVGEMLDRSEILSQISLDDSTVFVKLARSSASLAGLQEELVARREALEETEAQLAEENDALQAKFRAVAAEYERLRAQLARAAPAPASAPSSAVSSPTFTNGLACPVAGAVSFVDSWGAPRAGHTHQGVDMMAAYGTPIVAITSGTITYAAYDGSGGNMIFLSGDDGNAYWYMHNQENLVSGGHVSTGEQIATLGDTGNAAGTPHLHFEYHPGGGAAVNPYPLVAGLC